MLLICAWLDYVRKFCSQYISVVLFLAIYFRRQVHFLQNKCHVSDPTVVHTYSERG